MSRNGKLMLEFADNTYEFFLGIAQLDELDEITGVGPGTLIRRIANGDMRSKDLRSIIRLGLVGGGLKSAQALKLVERYVDPPNPLFAALPLAIRILAAAVYDEEADSGEVGVKKNDQQEASQPESTFASFTETVQ